MVTYCLVSLTIDRLNIGSRQINRVPVEQATNVVRLFRHGSEVFFWHAMCAQTHIKPKRFAERMSPCQNIWCRGASEAQSLANLSGLLRCSRCIGSQRMRENQRICDTMCQFVARSQRVGNGMPRGRMTGPRQTPP